jgi:hypothetical protein
VKTDDGTISFFHRFRRFKNLITVKALSRGVLGLLVAYAITKIGGAMRFSAPSSWTR